MITADCHLDHEATLFRGNSFATRLLTVYARASGYDYLRDSLKDLLWSMCQRSTDPGPVRGAIGCQMSVTC